jgi:hypothetical protein
LAPEFGFTRRHENTKFEKSVKSGRRKRFLTEINTWMGNGPVLHRSQSDGGWEKGSFNHRWAQMEIETESAILLAAEKAAWTAVVLHPLMASRTA